MDDGQRDALVSRVNKTMAQAVHQRADRTREVAFQP